MYIIYPWSPDIIQAIVSSEWAVATTVSNESLNDDKKAPSVAFLVHFINQVSPAEKLESCLKL